MEEQQTQPNVEQTKLDRPVEDRRSWEQPKLERLHVSLDTANLPGSGGDGQNGTNFPP